MMTYAQKNAPAFKSGDGATQTGSMERHAGTVVSVSQGGAIEWKRDTATRLTDPIIADGYCKNNHAIQYRYEPDNAAETLNFTLRHIYRDNGSIIGQSDYSPSNPNHTDDTLWVREGEPTRGGKQLIKGRKEFFDFMPV